MVNQVNVCGGNICFFTIYIWIFKFQLSTFFTYMSKGEI